MSRQSLDDILDGNNEPEAEAQEAQAPETPEPEQQPRDENGKFAEKGEKPEPEQAQAEPEPEAEPPSADPGTGLLAAKQAEKAKRQAAEKERDNFAAQLQSLRDELKTSKQPQPEPAPDMFADPEGWQTHFAGQNVSQAVQASAYHNKLNTSEFYARKNIEGFNDEWDGLNKWLSDNPAIAQQASADFDPWGFAWRQYNNQRQLEELGATDVADLETKLREKILAEMQASAPVETPKVPTSLSTKRSVGSRSGPAWTGPTPLGDLIGN